MLQFILYVIAGFSFWICSLGISFSEDRDELQLLLYKNGEVLTENFVYFSVQEEGNIRLSLNSMEGDADIYVAEHAKVPTYEPETYDLHSASCGEDIVNVPKSFKRPIVIGIYGNSAYKISKYQLRVEMLPNNNEPENRTSYADFEKPEVPDQKDYEERTNRNENLPRKSKQNQKIKTDKTYDVKSGIFGLLEIIAMVL